MNPARRIWHLPDVGETDASEDVVASILRQRGVGSEDARRLLDVSPFHDPFLLPDMGVAIDVIGNAIKAGKRIAVYGDYDVDGVTGTTILTTALQRAGVPVIPYIPNRMTEGYGLHVAAIAELAAQNVECVITVDCGTGSVEAASSRPSTMELVVTDHHLPLGADPSTLELAPAEALINPKLPTSTYPFDGLAGAGVAWKVVAALEERGLVPDGTAQDLLPWAALGTVADVMPLTGENRSIVSWGLERIAQDPQHYVGIAALCAVAKRPPTALRASDIAFSLAPRINAAGRMEDAKLALSLCLATQMDEAMRLAQELERHNTERKAVVERVMKEATARAQEAPDGPALVLGDASWPMGIVGLIAGRLAERYGCPTFVVCLDPTEAKGSARSAGAVHLVTALEGAHSELIRFGGHHMAAGFSLDAHNFDAFAAAVTVSVGEQWGQRDRERVVDIDWVGKASDFGEDLVEQLGRLEPCGMANPAPVLALCDATVVSVRTFGAGQHLETTLATADGVITAIAFNKPQWVAHLPKGRVIDVCGQLHVSEFRGDRTIGLLLRDLRVASHRNEASTSSLETEPISTGA